MKEVVKPGATSKVFPFLKNTGTDDLLISNEPLHIVVDDTTPEAPKCCTFPGVDAKDSPMHVWACGCRCHLVGPADP